MATSGYSGNLTIADLEDVLSALWDARAKWWDIGSCIGVDVGTLDTIKREDDNCFGEMLNNWLRGVYNPKEKNSKPRTWRTLIEALRDKIVREEAMANKLEREKPSDPDTNQDLKKIVISVLFLGVLAGITTCIVILLMPNISDWKLGYPYYYYEPPHELHDIVHVQLNGTISDGDIVCPGQVITFTCVTSGSELLTWFIDDYNKSQLEFANYHNLNLTRMGAVPGTVAVLTRNTVVDGTIVLVSQLTIKVPDSEIFSNTSVSCLHVRDDTRQTVNFRYLNFAKPEISQLRILVEQRRHTVAMNTCVLSLTWNFPVNYNLESLSGYMVNIDGENIVNKTDNLNASLNYFALLLYCGTHNVSLRAFDNCGRVSNSTPVITVIPEIFPFSLITPDPTASTGPGGSSECSKSTTRDTSPSTILGGLLGVVIIVFAIVIAVMAIFELWKSKYKHTFRLNQQKS